MQQPALPPPTFLDAVWDSIITPGASPGLVATINGALLVLLVVCFYFGASGVVPTHLAVLAALAAGLLVSFNWCVRVACAGLGVPRAWCVVGRTHAQRQGHRMRWVVMPRAAGVDVAAEGTKHTTAATRAAVTRTAVMTRTALTRAASHTRRPALQVPEPRRC